MSEEVTAAEKTESAYTPDQINSVISFADALKLAREIHGDVTETNAVRVMRIEDKKRLCGKPLVLMEWQTLWSEENNRNYVSALVVVDEGNSKTSKWFLNDGSTGIYEELTTYTERTGKSGGVLCEAGLRVSEYHIDPDTRKPLTRAQVARYKRDGLPMEDASTFYLDV
jgi:hypothetical protein